jgi:OOP family OmpA-OmpF porin
VNVKSWIIVIISLLWGLLCWYWYTCQIKGFCVFSSQLSAHQTHANNTPPIAFRKSSFVCIKNESFLLFADSLTRALNDGHNFSIVGLYDASEINKSKYNNLGLARAFAIKSLLAEKLDTSNIKTYSKPFEIVMQKDVCIGYFLDFEKTAQLTDSSTSIKNNETYEKFFDVNQTIYFKPNSVKIENLEEAEIYLNKLAEVLRRSKDKISIIGHTNHSENDRLDRARAWVIKSHLLNKGVESIQLITGGKASNEPNTKSPNNQTQNRNGRVVIQSFH